MGIDYTQHCVYGLAIHKDEVEAVVSPAVYEQQNRYNPKTGQVSHTEKTLVKESEEKYSVLGVAAESFYELSDGLQAAFPDLQITYSYDEDIIYVGYNVADKEDGGRVTLLEGSIDIESLMDLHKQLAQKLQKLQSDDKFSLWFFSVVG
jgi:hypothetical protein